MKICIDICEDGSPLISSKRVSSVLLVRWIKIANKIDLAAVNIDLQIVEVIKRRSIVRSAHERPSLHKHACECVIACIYIIHIYITHVHASNTCIYTSASVCHESRTCSGMTKQRTMNNVRQSTTRRNDAHPSTWSRYTRGASA